MVHYNGYEFNKVFSNIELVALFPKPGHQGGDYRGVIVNHEEMYRHINQADDPTMWYAKVLEVPDNSRVWHNENDHKFHVDLCRIEPAKYLYYEYENCLSAISACDVDQILDKGPLTYQLCLALHKYGPHDYYKRFIK